MDEKLKKVADHLNNEANTLVKDGITISGSTGQFNSGGDLPKEGTWTLLASNDEKNIVLESTTNGTIVVLYRALDPEGGEHWISKNTLFGKHYVLEEGEYPMPDIICRTTGFEMEWIEKATLKPDFLKKKTAARKQFDVFLFKENIKITFSTAHDVYTAENYPEKKTSWDPERKVMNMAHPREEYVLLKLSKD